MIRRRLVLLAVLAAALAGVPGALAHGTSGLVAGKGSFTGEQRYLMILAGWGPQPYSVEQVREILSQTDALTRRQSFGKSWIASDVTPWLSIPQQDCDTNRIAALSREAAQRAGYDLSKYNRFGFLFPRNECPFSGMGSAEQTWYNGRLSVRLVAHELGHTYGLIHSNTWECTTVCTIIEYGDPYDIMGGGVGDFNAYEKHEVGWMPNVTPVATAGTYPIERLEVPTSASQALVITTASSEYWIYHRLDRLPFADSFLPTGVLITAGPNPQAPPDQVVFGQTNLLLPDPVGRDRAAIFPGETFVEKDVFELAVVAQRGNTMDVRFAWTDRKAPGAPRIAAPGKRVRAGGTLEISWDDAHELGSGLSHYDVSVDGKAATRVPVKFGFTPLVRMKTPSVGAHTIRVTAVDRAGNRGAAATKRFVVFKPKPKSKRR